MAYYKFTWERLITQTYPILKFKSLDIIYDIENATESIPFENHYYPSSLAETIGNEINNLNDALYTAVEYKKTVTSNKITNELILNIDIPAVVYSALLRISNSDDENEIFLLGEYITELPPDFEIFTICEPIITTTTTTTSTTTTTTVAP